MEISVDLIRRAQDRLSLVSPDAGTGSTGDEGSSSGLWNRIEVHQRRHDIVGWHQ